MFFCLFIVTKVYFHVIGLVWELRLYIKYVPGSGQFASPPRYKPIFLIFLQSQRAEYYVRFWKKKTNYCTSELCPSLILRFRSQKREEKLQDFHHLPPNIRYRTTDCEYVKI